MSGGQATARRPRTMARRSGAQTASDLVTREISIGPGGSTGWHYHLVPLMAVVGSGTLTRILSDGTVEVHHAGSSFVEPAGIQHVHLGRNLGAEPVVLHITAAIAEGAPFAVPAQAPAQASDEAAYLPAHPVEAA
ncbi:cupin domain-containing protein [Streptomyces sp. ISL-66]|uniref:cupin domain-containing protein n=1 Tax=Streptomyces sp. ISL-66 TaxID=2819186 RepID=UPI00203575C4|nr:cupin domain-containing protein [Streptomyces sp. ISL-66]